MFNISALCFHASEQLLAKTDKKTVAFICRTLPCHVHKKVMNIKEKIQKFLA